MLAKSTLLSFLICITGKINNIFPHWLVVRMDEENQPTCMQNTFLYVLRSSYMLLSHLSARGKPWRTICWFLWYKFSNQDQFQATSIQSLNAELERDRHNRLSRGSEELLHAISGCFSFPIFKVYLFWEREGESTSRGGAERGCERIPSRLHAEPRHGARTHELWDHDLSRNQVRCLTDWAPQVPLGMYF